VQARRPPRRWQRHCFPIHAARRRPSRRLRHFSAAQKIEHLIGLDRCYEILSWGPITHLDPVRRSMQLQVMRILLPIGIKAMLDGSLDRDLARERSRAAVLEELDRKLGASRLTAICSPCDPAQEKLGTGEKGLGFTVGNAGAVGFLGTRWRAVFRPAAASSI
jgi:hypothetical protein